MSGLEHHAKSNFPKQILRQSEYIHGSSHTRHLCSSAWVLFFLLLLLLSFLFFGLVMELTL